MTVRSDGGTQDLTLVPEDPLGQLQKYSATQCFKKGRGVNGDAQVQGLRDDRLQVFVDPGQAQVGVMGTTILFQPRDPGALRAMPGDAAGVRRVALRPNRCDAHARWLRTNGRILPGVGGTARRP